ncbi:MAG: CRTAC1 family protein [Lentisphaeria bacterium]|nr:CRTAC1 family protein [Lentisphaeria bacterium]
MYRITAITLSLMLLTFACRRKPQEKPAEPPRDAAEILDGHQRMRAILGAIARQTADGHPYLGDRRARELRATWAQRPAAGEEMRKWLVSCQLGVYELRLGRVTDAIEHLERARTLSSQLEVRPEDAAGAVFDLAVAYLRLGEVENCCLRHNPESCILPIQGGGVHTESRGSRDAIRYFSEVIDMAPGTEIAAHARWLMNIAYMTLGQYPDGVPEAHRIAEAALMPEQAGFPRFRNVAGQLGLDVFDLAGGAIADDFDNDGFLDLMLSTWDTTEQMHYFRNEGDGTFSDQTAAAGLSGFYGGLHMMQADYNNDGFLDILVLRGAWIARGQHPNSLLRNNGDGTFTDVTFAAGLGDVHYPTQTAAWADYDNDGDLDLYVGNEAVRGFDAPCQLFRNSGDGTFVDVALEAGVQNDFQLQDNGSTDDGERRFPFSGVTPGTGRQRYGFTKGVSWGDYDGDRFPDLYVSNFDQPNRLYHNNRDGTFTDKAVELGVTGPRISFPVWFWDFDNDGNLDVFVSGYSANAVQVLAHYLGDTPDRGLPRLYRGDGSGGFEDITQAQNLAYPMLTMGSNFGDLDNDGFLDFYIGTGDPEFSSLLPNLMFLNKAGNSFVDITMASGFGHLQKGHAIAFADFDHDGDLDVYEQMGGAYPGDKYNNALYENPGFGNRWITLQLVGTTSNRCAIGARIVIRIEVNGAVREIYRHVNSGGSFGGNPLRQTIGLGQAEQVQSLEVYWPASDQTQRFESIPANQGYRITEGSDHCRPLRLTKVVLGEE